MTEDGLKTPKLCLFQVTANEAGGAERSSGK